MKRAKRTEIFVERIAEWFAENRRDLPWRRDREIQDDAERAYRVLVSEIMLQQTQVGRVIPAYRNFLERFPTLQSLAVSSNRDVLLIWRGMGYNSRALRLRDVARAIAGCKTFPCDMEGLMCLPGIGHYTAAAIRNFAFGIKTPCLDTNIRRILHRTFVGPEHADGTWEKDDRYLLRLADLVLDEAMRIGKFMAADWHDALMDYGSLVCTKRSPKWEECPLTRAGIMKAAYRVPSVRFLKSAICIREPGRFVGSRFIPNRIFRGRIVEELRDEPIGLPLAEIGRRVCLDWSEEKHHMWLVDLMKKLSNEKLLMRCGAHYRLFA